MNRIVLATGNMHKVKEIDAMLSQLSLTVVPQSDYKVTSAPETGTTFVENAIIKARNAAAQTGLPAIADDSGIEVDALNGAPGVYSSRFAGEEGNDRKNLLKLIDSIRSVPEDSRTCRYWCIMVYMRHQKDPTPVICQASWEGTLVTEPRGTNGFGYDPIFLIPEEGLTAAEISLEKKNSMSHRAKALSQLLERLREVYRR
ncbi:MAG: RdgB/HAM1 family non-canonical purine NTP pyrophosphatase [Succinivibrionaceae bacterium]|nr:RdgB/HAM1 family non-canonical purine NTP pyrophosphatase [Succinivibrionaceae bacterium]